MNGIAKMSTPAAELREQMMSSMIAKTEREWWARARIAELEAERESFYMAYRMKADVETKALTVERDALRADLARISEELGLPPTIGPAPGELRRIIDAARAKP